MTTFTEYLQTNRDGFRVIVDHRAAARVAPVPSTVTSEASGGTNPSQDISRLAREAVPATAYVSRGGTIFVLSLHGSGRVVYEAVKGAPSALQRRAIAVIGDALAVARGETPALSSEPVAEPVEETASEPVAEPVVDPVE